MTTTNATTADTNSSKTDDVTEIVTIVDRSGSMASVLDDAIGGFNAFLGAQQKTGGKASFTLVQFNDGYDVIYNGIDILYAKQYNRTTYVPAGMTALFDAVGRAISEVTARTAGQKPKKVFVAILTDGHENSSREFTREQVRQLIEARKAEEWEFIYLGVGLDQFAAEREGAGIGIRADKVAIYMKDKHGIDMASEQMDNAAKEYRATGRLESDRWKKEKFG